MSLALLFMIGAYLLICITSEANVYLISVMTFLAVFLFLLRWITKNSPEVSQNNENLHQHWVLNDDPEYITVDAVPDTGGVTDLPPTYKEAISYVNVNFGHKELTTPWFKSIE